MSTFCAEVADFEDFRKDKCQILPRIFVRENVRKALKTTDRSLLRSEEVFCKFSGNFDIFTKGFPSESLSLENGMGIVSMLHGYHVNVLTA